jgi:Ran GTPase-activating protein (RanGAP) involved in mRNA processing and transport
VQALSRSVSLSFINLWCNFIGPVTAEALGDMLCHAPALRELQLGSNQIGNAVRTLFCFGFFLFW